MHANFYNGEPVQPLWLNEQKKIDDDLKTAITQAVEEFTTQFVETRKGAVA